MTGGRRSVDRPASLSREAFIETYGGVYEHSPWIAAAAYDEGLTQESDSADGLARVMAGVVAHAPKERRLALLRAHPDLAGRLALSDGLTASSSAEQSAAGLDQCTPDELAAFQRLNSDYVKKFDFPFILAVSGYTRGEILKIFAARLNNAIDCEFETAISEVHKIARLRLVKLAQGSAEQ